jgi:hypothetical protein
MKYLANLIIVFPALNRNVPRGLRLIFGRLWPGFGTVELLVVVAALFCCRPHRQPRCALIPSAATYNPRL